MKIGIDRELKGGYILLVELTRTCRIRVGALEKIEFPQGFYAYVGSAMGGLQARLNRYLRRVKRARWHIDYLLMEGKVKGVIYSPTDERLECLLAHRLKEIFRSFPGFGSSDCRCPSHLFFSEELKVLREEAKEIFRDLLKGEEPVVEEW
ncbi:MAG: GIY-YIG nuclease family protein [Deltaproteobacteria bacterium]|nr:GIY-YIG nuclease family protein [Deltaproteobacteria bacterium]